jgi:O-antigen/teichoic acid export membrane protein
MNTGRSALAHFLSRIGVSVAGFVATFFIARELGSEALGLYTIGVALLFVVKIPLSAVGSAISKRVSEGHEEARFFWSGITINATIGVVLAGGIVGGGELVNEYVGADVAIFLAALVLLQALLIAVQAGLIGHKRVAQSGLVDVVERIGRTGFQIVLVLIGFHVAGLYLGFVASLAVSVVLALVLVGGRPSVPSTEQFRSLLDFTKFSWVGQLRYRSFGWMDTIVLAFFVGPGLIGVYEVAWTLSNVLALAGGSIQQTLFPELSDLSSQGEVEKIRHFVDEAIVYGGLFTVPGLFGALVLGEEVLAIYRPEFSTGATVLVILIGAQLATLYGNQFLTAVDAVDRPDVSFRVNGVFVVVNLVANVVLVATVGWVGAAIATAFSSLVTLVMSFRALSDLLGGLSVPTAELGKQLLASLVMFGAVALLKTVSPTGIPGTLALVTAGVSVYGVVLLALSSRVRDKVWYVLPVAR